MLDNFASRWYHISVRVGIPCEHCDDAGDCVLDGNFCGVCPVIGRLNASLRWRISPGRRRMVGACRPIFMPWNDTHGGADRRVRPYPAISQLSTLYQGGKTNYGKPNDPHSTEGL